MQKDSQPLRRPLRMVVVIELSKKKSPRRDSYKTQAKPARSNCKGTLRNLQMDCAGKDVVLCIHEKTPGKLKFLAMDPCAAALGPDPLAHMQAVALKRLCQSPWSILDATGLRLKLSSSTGAKAWRRQAEPISSGLQLLIACRELRLLFFRPS